MTHPVRLILSYQGVFCVDKWRFCGVFYVGKWVFAIFFGQFERFSGTGRFEGTMCTVPTISIEPNDAA